MVEYYGDTTGDEEELGAMSPQRAGRAQMQKKTTTTFWKARAFSSLTLLK